MLFIGTVSSLYSKDRGEKYRQIGIQEYEEGNYPEAARFFDKAIKLGNTQAMILHANIHEKGLAGEVNLEKANKLYSNAAFKTKSGTIITSDSSLERVCPPLKHNLKK